jgi:hypothetical protein
MSDLPLGWVEASIEDVFGVLKDGRTLHQGWSPQCEKEPSRSDDEWGVLKTTAIQDGAFLPEHNKRLPDRMEPRSLIEVNEGDVLITCAGPRARCGISCLVPKTRPRLMMSGKMYRFRVPERYMNPRYVAFYLQTAAARFAIDRMKTGISDSGLNLTHDRFRRLQIPVAPHGEQIRIIAALEEHFSWLDAGITALNDARRRLDQLRNQANLALITGKGTKVRLADVCDLRLGRQRSPKNHSGPNMVPYLRAANVTWDGLDLSDVKQMNFTVAEVSIYRLKPGDVLVGGVRLFEGRDLVLISAWIIPEMGVSVRLRMHRALPRVICAGRRQWRLPVGVTGRAVPRCRVRRFRVRFCDPGPE